jgi:putative aldouronate transport system permease protein
MKEYELDLRVKMRQARQNYALYLFFLPCLIYYIVFHYAPMYGVQIAFKDFYAGKGILGSPWAGFKHFQRFFKSYQFWALLRNTIFLSIYRLVAQFPIPIMLALLINQHPSSRFRRVVQTVTYAPHFISVVVLVGMLNVFFSVRSGLVNQAIKTFSGEAIPFLTGPSYFRDLFVWSAIWQHVGWSTIIYLATLSSIDPQLHEAAIVDGATRLQRIRHIDIPGILPTATILLIMNLGRVMQIGFQKAFLMQNALNLETSEIIQTYVYKIGLLNAQFSFSAAVGLFNALINLFLLLSVNRIARKVGETSLW